MAVVDAKLIPVLIEKLQTELDEIKVSLNWLIMNYCYMCEYVLFINECRNCLQCFDAVGWVSGRASDL